MALSLSLSLTHSLRHSRQIYNEAQIRTGEWSQFHVYMHIYVYIHICVCCLDALDKFIVNIEHISVKESVLYIHVYIYIY